MKKKIVRAVHTLKEHVGGSRGFGRDSRSSSPEMEECGEYDRNSVRIA